MAFRLVGNKFVDTNDPQFQMYNALGRDAGQQTDNRNFFERRASSIGNAVGTTGAAIASDLKSGGVFFKGAENIATEDLLKDTKTRMNDIAKKYGHNTWADWQDAYAEVKNSGDETKKAEMDEQLKEFQAQANTNADEATSKANRYRDYLDNNYVSQKVNQDRGKFLGSAINTLSTAADVMLPGAGVAFNAVQGGVEGIADELEQNGLENFDWSRAGQNALTGAVTGGVVGGLNKGLSNSLAKNGGNLFKGDNALTRGLNNLGSKTALGRAGATIATGAARGALSGAVGGATGAGLSSALNGVEFGQGVQNALQGAVQGAQQGAMAGGAMAGANMAINKTPGVGNFMQKVNQAGADWEASGDTARERWKNTWNSGNSPVSNKIVDFMSDSGRFGKEYTSFNGDADGAINYLNNRQQGVAKSAIPTSEDGNVDLPYGREDYYFNQRRNQPGGGMGLAHIESDDGRTIQDAYNMVDTLSNGRRVESDNPTRIAYENTDGTRRAIISTDFEGKEVDPYVLSAYNKKAPVAESKLNLDTTGASDSIISQSEQNVNKPETWAYRTIAGETEASRTNPDLMYGESELGNRTRRGMVADSLERFGNTLEGAQTNVTRAAAKDLGIESTGKVVENVRKKTGITNLETQARLAKELTGGENSLMDNIQRQALNASENGQPYKVDTAPVLNEVDAIVDKYADTNMFGSTTARNKFISNLKRDVSNFDSDVLSIANRMKANAADLRGKGVASPTPADSAKAKIYTEVANKLDDLSYKAIPQENVEAMFDATISEMRGRANQAKQNGNNDVAKAYTKLADSLDAEPRTIKAFRSFKKDFVDASKISELTNRAENGAAIQMGRGFGGGVKRFLGTVAQRPVNATLAKAGGAVNKLADKIAGESTPTSTPTTETTNTNYNPATQVYNAIGRTEGATNAEQARTSNYIADAVQTANTLEDLATPSYTNATSVYNSIYGNPSSTNGDYWTSVLSNAMDMARAAGDANAFSQLYSMYQDATSKQSSTTETKLTDKQRQANAAARALADFETVEPNFAYDVSDIPIIGGIANWGGNEYASKAEALALQIGYMLSGATVNKEEAKNIGMAYVPQPRDSEAVRKSKLAQLRGIISDYQQTYAE